MAAAWIMAIISDENINNTNATFDQLCRFLLSFCLSDSFRGITFPLGREMTPCATR